MILADSLRSPIRIGEMSTTAALGGDACITGSGPLQSRPRHNQGQGVRRDVDVARQWFKKAAALGNPEAKQNLRGIRK